MFYEEKYIDGELMCRRTPDGKWERISYLEMSIRLARAEKMLSGVLGCVAELHRSLEEHKKDRV